MREWDGWEWDPEEMEPVDCGQTGQDGKQFVRGLLQGRQAKAGGEAREERTGTGTGTGTCLDGGPRGVCKVEKRTPARKRGCGVPAALYWELHLGRPSRRIPAWQFEFFFLPRSLLRSATGAPSRSSAQEGEGQRVCVCVCEGVPGGASIRCVQSSARVRASLCWGRVLAPPRRVPE